MFSMAQERSQMMPVVQDSLWGTIGNAQDRMENRACSQSILLDMSWCSGSLVLTVLIYMVTSNPTVGQIPQWATIKVKTQRGLFLNTGTDKL